MKKLGVCLLKNRWRVISFDEAQSSLWEKRDRRKEGRRRHVHHPMVGFRSVAVEFTVFGFGGKGPGGFVSWMGVSEIENRGKGGGIPLPWLMPPKKTG